MVISITCALLATLLQEWARRYLKVTQLRYTPHKRARIRAFFAEGVDKFLLPWAVEALPTLLHLSLFLFFAGLAVFLWNVNLTIFKLVLSWIGLCTALYGCITFIPVFCHDSPYHTPLSLPLWHFVTGIRFLTFRALKTITYYLECFIYQTNRFRFLAEGSARSLVQGMRKSAEETAFNSPPEIDTRAFMRTLDYLDEDHELERFFTGLPGFRSSKMVKDPLPNLKPEDQEKLWDTLIGLLDRTSSSDLLPEAIKIRRTIICGKALGVAISPEKRRFLHRILSGAYSALVKSAEIIPIVKGWDNGKDEGTTMVIRAIVSSIIARAQLRDDVWFTMAADEMGVPESVLRSYATHGNSLSLAILIWVVRKQYSLIWEPYWPRKEFSKFLEAASKFDVLDTSPELQHEFCALWNEVTRGAGYHHSQYILRLIRNIYLTLHLHTICAPTQFPASTGDEDPVLQQGSTYPLCNMPGHHPDSTPHIHDASTSTAIPRSDSAALVPSFPPDTLSPSVDEYPMDAQIFMESICDYATSPYRAAAGAARDGPSARTIPPTTRETSTATPSVPPHAAHFGALEFLASPEPVLGNAAGPSLSLTLL